MLTIVIKDKKYKIRSFILRVVISSQLRSSISKEPKIDGFFHNIKNKNNLAINTMTSLDQV